MIHVTLPQLCAFLDGELAEASAELVRRHLSECLECTERFGRMEEQDEALARILSDEPAEEFFQQLCASIPLGQPTKAKKTEPPVKSKPAKPAVVRSAIPAPARPRRRAEDRETPAFSMRAAVIAAVVCCVVAASVAWVALRPRGAAPPPPPETEQTERTPAEETPAVESGPTPEELLERSAEEQPAESPEETPAPAESTTPAPPARETRPPAPRAPAPEKLVERAPKHFVPVRTVITQTTLDPSRESAAPAPPPARVAPKPDPVAAVRAARIASLESAKSKLPPAFDKSASAWERTIPLLENTPETLAVARREWAQARFQAWAAEPTPARRESAIAATRQYLLYAPPGPERDQAWTWLGRLKH